ITAAEVRQARDALSTATGGSIDAVALGSPHFSADEVRALALLAAGRRFRIPVYVCTGRHTVDALAGEGVRDDLEAQGAIFVVDTCVVVTPVLPAGGGTMMTNSGKFAHYAAPNTGYGVVFGSLADCVETAVSGDLWREAAAWR
ncbi:MAG: aconitase X, partial [Rhodospirillaceae bacterium]